MQYQLLAVEAATENTQTTQLRPAVIQNTLLQAIGVRPCKT